MRLTRSFCRQNTLHYFGDISYCSYVTSHLKDHFCVLFESLAIPDVSNAGTHQHFLLQNKIQFVHRHIEIYLEWLW